MARKLKFKSNIAARQPGLFDISELCNDSTEIPVHPSIDTFIATHISSKKMNSATSNNTTGGFNSDDCSADYDSMELDTSSLQKSSALLFLSFGSGSSGNCAYIGSREAGILIDAGVDPATVRDALRDNGFKTDCIKGICLTHDHSDHVRYVYQMVRKHPEIGIYCTPKTLNGMLRRHSISRRIKDYHRPIYKEFPFKVGQLEITAFDVSHDGTDNAGFFITCGNHRFAIATDLGCITPRVDHYMRQAQYMMLESNYDADMLHNGTYPRYLQARIEADHGHLDNTVTADFLASCYTPSLTHVFLCHLSKDNNTPEIALRQSRNALYKAGAAGVGDGSDSIESRDMPIQLVALPRYGASQLFILRANV